MRLIAILGMNLPSIPRIYLKVLETQDRRGMKYEAMASRMHQS